MRLWRKSRVQIEIAPDEIFIDSSNVAQLDRDQFEGRIERPLNRRAFVFTGAVLATIFALLLGRASVMQVAHGATYEEMAENNQLSQKVLFADRGEIVDRTGLPLAYNERDATQDFSSRVYAAVQGIAHVVGYAKSPAKDSSGMYYRDAFMGVDGAEKAFDAQLAGKNGVELTQTDAHGKVIAQSTTEDPQSGQTLTLSIDAHVTQGLYTSLAKIAQQSNFQGGAAVIMDIHTGELLALTSYPEFSQNALEQGDASALKALNSDPHLPFLDRATTGLYAPGSIVKPIVAAAALTEGVIDENKQILSTGSISVPNPYDKAHPSIFKDWRANGWVDVRHAIAYSSDVYFYEVGGGYPGQLGLGIDRLHKYFAMFGFGSPTGLNGFSESAGNVPTIGWKAATFPEDPTWRLGDTYHTAIGQYGMQLTPLQAVREAAAIANGGTLLTPQLLATSTPEGSQLAVSSHALQVVREGMRLGVTDGIAKAVQLDFVHVAAKTGTAQIGTHNQFLNSWMIGFFPYEHPRYAYAMVLERGPAGTLMGSPAAMGQFLLWMHDNAPQYLQ
jgi:penicillin-binding protein 2